MRYYLGMVEEDERMEDEIDGVMEEGIRKEDIWQEGNKKVGKKEMGDEIIEKLKEIQE